MNYEYIPFAGSHNLNEETLVGRIYVADAGTRTVCADYGFRI